MKTPHVSERLDGFWEVNSANKAEIFVDILLVLLTDENTLCSHNCRRQTLLYDRVFIVMSDNGILCVADEILTK